MSRGGVGDDRPVAHVIGLANEALAEAALQRHTDNACFASSFFGYLARRTQQIQNFVITSKTKTAPPIPQVSTKIS